MKNQLFLTFKQKNNGYGVRVIILLLLSSGSLFSQPNGSLTAQKKDSLTTQKKDSLSAQKINNPDSLDKATLTALVSIFSTFDKYAIVRPKVDIVAHQHYNSFFTYNFMKFDGYAKLFFGNNDRYDRRSLFVPEASQFGLDVKFSIGIKKTWFQVVKFNGSLGYYGKQLNRSEDTSVFVGTSLVNFGPSITFFKEALTFYCNWNSNGIIHGNKKLKDYLSNPIDNYQPFEFGARTTLNLSKEKNIGYLDIDIRFIKNNKLDRFTMTDDWGIPVMNIGYRKDWDFKPKK